MAKVDSMERPCAPRRSLFHWYIWKKIQKKGKVCVLVGDEHHTGKKRTNLQPISKLVQQLEDVLLFFFLCFAFTSIAEITRVLYVHKQQHEYTIRSDRREKRKRVVTRLGCGEIETKKTIPLIISRIVLTDAPRKFKVWSTRCFIDGAPEAQTSSMM